jgi:hypothetical protein
MTKEEGQLAEVVARIIELQRNQMRINPSWIATEAMKVIDPKNRSIELVRIGCHLQLRQTARGQCRKSFESPDEGDDDQPQFVGFDDLQWRYLTARSKGLPDPEYILREGMTDEDIAYNVARLRREGRAKRQHADF